MDSAFTLTPDTSKTDLTITTLTAIATIVTPTNTGRTVTIIGTITIEIMIGIEALPICFQITNFLGRIIRIKAGSARLDARSRPDRYKTAIEQLLWVALQTKRTSRTSVRSGWLTQEVA
jgi:hypothetical protein